MTGSLFPTTQNIICCCSLFLIKVHALGQEMWLSSTYNWIQSPCSVEKRKKSHCIWISLNPELCLSAFFWWEQHGNGRGGRLPKYFLGTFGKLVNGASSSMDMVLLGTDGASGNCGSSELPAVLRDHQVDKGRLHKRHICLNLQISPHFLYFNDTCTHTLFRIYPAVQCCGITSGGAQGTTWGIGGQKLDQPRSRWEHLARCVNTLASVPLTFN